MTRVGSMTTSQQKVACSRDWAHHRRHTATNSVWHHSGIRSAEAACHGAHLPVATPCNPARYHSREGARTHDHGGRPRAAGRGRLYFNLLPPDRVHAPRPKHPLHRRVIVESNKPTPIPEQSLMT